MDVCQAAGQRRRKMSFFRKLFGGNPDSENNIPEIEEEPFIKPYDFYVEADNRHSAEKTFETERPQSVDILQVLDEMELAFDIINDFGVRRKLKKLYSELAFEIDEYISYAGGRSADSFATEEIDDSVYEIHAAISRKDDDSPFEVTIRISEDQE